MEKDKKNQLIVVSIILMLFIVVILFTTYSIIKGNNNEELKSKVKVQQIYTSDYRIKMLNEKFFIGSYNDNKINVIIDSGGIEIYKDSLEILYDGIYMMEDGKSLIYNHMNDEVNMYVFDGEDIKFYYSIKNINYIKPIIYLKNNQKFILGFASVIEDNLHLFNVADKTEVILKDKSIVGDANSNEGYYVYNKYIVVKDVNGMMGVVDIDGKQIIDYDYVNIIGTCNNSFIALSKKNKYGIIDENNKALLNFNYEVISSYDNYYLVVDNKNNMALYDKSINNLTGFKMKYDDLIEFDLRKSSNSLYLFTLSNKLVVLNNYHELMNGTEYDKHNMYVIEDGKIIDTKLQKDFEVSQIVYMVDMKNNLSIYDRSLNEILSIRLDDDIKINNVRYVKDDVIELIAQKGEETVKQYYNLQGENVNFDLGDMIIKNENFSCFIKEENDMSIIYVYDNNGKLVDKREGKSIQVNDNFIIVDNSIYKIVVS